MSISKPDTSDWAKIVKGNADSPPTATEVSMEMEREWRAGKAKEYEAAIRADEREKIKVRLMKHRQMDMGRGVLCAGLTHALIVIDSPDPTPNPPTREQVLEEALRKISYFGPELRGADACASIARRALEWKP